MRLGHIHTHAQIFAAFDLSETARRFVTGNLPRLKRGQTTSSALLSRAVEAGLVDGEVPNAVVPGDGQPRDLLAGLVLGGPARGPMGRRTTDEIISRLERKTRQPRDPEEMRRALDLASRLAKLEGPAGWAIQEARSLATAAGATSDSLEPLEEVVELLFETGMDGERVVLDFGMARGFAYYTGALFDLTLPGHEGVLGGGGRYDRLVETLGGPSIPALGFAYDTEAVARVVGGA